MAAEVPSRDIHCKSKGEKSVTADQRPQSRPVRDAAVRGRCKVQQWTGAREDVMD